MANLLHRLLRGRHAPQEAEAPPAPQSPAAAETEPDAGAPDGQPVSRPKREPKGKGPRKTRDEVSSIGPGEPS
jgi:hypothetical protein